jgi:hypothetical protein
MNPANFCEEKKHTEGVYNFVIEVDQESTVIFDYCLVYFFILEP